MGRELVKDADYELPENLKIFFTLSQLDIDTISIEGGRKIIVKGIFGDNRQEDLTNETSFTSDDLELDGNVVSGEKEGTVTATYTDFTGEIHTKTIHFGDGTASIHHSQSTIHNYDEWYDLQGRRLESRPTKNDLYIHDVRKVIIK